MGYEIRQFRPEFKEQILELQTYLWSPDVDLNAAYLSWKYDQNPYIEQPIISVAFSAGKAIAMMGVQGAIWEVGDPPKQLAAPCAADGVVHPEHRRRGLYTRLMLANIDELARRKYKFILMLSSNRKAFPALMKMGMQKSENLQTIHFGDPSESSAASAAKELWKSTAEPGHPFKFLDQHKNNVSPNITVEHEPRPREMANLVAKICSKERIQHVRDEHYFEWRFRNPLSQYRFHFWKDHQQQGYLVLQTNVRKGDNRVSIVDWEAANIDVRESLLATAIHFCRLSRISTWAATLSDEKKSCLKKYGFKHLTGDAKMRDDHRTIVAAQLAEGEQQNGPTFGSKSLLDLANWDMRMIYSDGF